VNKRIVRLWPYDHLFTDSRNAAAPIYASVGGNRFFTLRFTLFRHGITPSHTIVSISDGVGIALVFDCFAIPWIIGKTQSRAAVLTNRSSFRDLTKPT
jgi:hypothetical protein